MSFKAKDLQFDKSQPAFLQRLRGQLTGDDAARHEQPIPRNKRLKQDDDDDAPTYVMEDSNQSLTKEEYDALLSGKDGQHDEQNRPEDVEKQLTTGDTSKGKDKIAEVGANAKKRKAAKVIGDEQDVKDKNTGAEDVNAKAVKKSKKKTKAVRLTFGDEEED